MLKVFPSKEAVNETTEGQSILPSETFKKNPKLPCPMHYTARVSFRPLHIFYEQIRTTKY